MLFLSVAIVSTQVRLPLSQAVLLKKVVKHADNAVGPLPRVASFMPLNYFTTYPKDSALTWGEEVYVAFLELVGGIVNLLCHVERVVDNRGKGAGFTSG